MVWSSSFWIGRRENNRPSFLLVTVILQQRMREWLIETTKCGKQPISSVQILNFLKTEESLLKSDELGFQAATPSQQQQQQQQQQNTAGHEVSVVPFVLTPTLMNDSGAALTCFVLLRSLQQQQRHASSPDNLRRYRMETPSVLRRSSQLNTTSSSTSHSLSWNGSRCHTDSRTKLSGAGASEELVENEPPPAQACGESGAMANQVRHAVPAAAMMITMLIIITTTCTIQVFWKDTHPDEDGTDTSSGHAMDEE